MYNCFFTAPTSRKLVELGPGYGRAVHSRQLGLQEKLYLWGKKKEEASWSWCPDWVANSMGLCCPLPLKTLQVGTLVWPPDIALGCMELTIRAVYWWRDATSGSCFRRVVALSLVTSLLAYNTEESCIWSGRTKFVPASRSARIAYTCSSTSASIGCCVWAYSVACRAHPWMLTGMMIWQFLHTHRCWLQGIVLIGRNELASASSAIRCWRRCESRGFLSFWEVVRSFSISLCFTLSSIGQECVGFWFLFCVFCWGLFAGCGSSSLILTFHFDRVV